MNKIGVANVLMTAILAVTAFGSVASAMETTGDSMMKKDEAMMQKDTMVKSDSMMSGDSMTYEDDLWFGSRGDKVVTLQTILEEKGLLVIPTGVAKGYFGPLTKAATMKYQAMLGVKNTGYYGPLTRAAMKAMMGKDGAMMKKDGDAMMQKTGQ